MSLSPPAVAMLGLMLMVMFLAGLFTFVENRKKSHRS